MEKTVISSEMGKQVGTEGTVCDGVCDGCRSSAGTTVRPLPARPESAAHQLGELNFLKCIAAY